MTLIYSLTQKSTQNLNPKVKANGKAYRQALKLGELRLVVRNNQKERTKIEGTRQVPLSLKLLLESLELGLNRQLNGVLKVKSVA